MHSILRSGHVPGALWLKYWTTGVTMLLLSVCCLSSKTLKAQTAVMAVVQNYGLQVSHGAPLQTRYRTYVFQNTGTAAYMGTVDFKYLQLHNGLEVNSISVFTCDTDPSSVLSSAGPAYINDPLPALAAAGTSPVCTTYTTASVPTAANSSTWTTSIPINIPANNYVCVVEAVTPDRCVRHLTNLASELEIKFPGVTPNLIQTQTSYVLPRVGGVKLDRDYNTLTSPSAPFNVPNYTDPITGSACSGSDIERSVTYTLGNKSLKDPMIRLRFNTLAEDFITLLEVDEADIDITLNLDLDGDGINETNISNVPLSTLLGVTQNDFYVDTWGKEDTSGQVLPAHTLPTTYNSSWLMDQSINYPINLNSYPAESKRNAIYYVPSLKDASTPKVGLVTLHLSRLIIPLLGGGTTAPFNAAQVSSFDSRTSAFPYGSTAPVGDPNYDDAFIEIHPGSSFTIHYKGTFVPQGDMDPSFDHFKNKRPVSSVEVAQMVGFTTCPGTPLQRRSVLTSGSNIFVVQNMVADGTKTAQLLMGNPDNQTNTVDGQLGNVVFDMGEITPLHKLQSSPLLFDHACSELEMVVELDAGLGVPCPNNLGANISFSSGSCTSGDAFGFGTDYYQGMSNSSVCGDPGHIPFEDKVEIDEFFKFISGGRTIYPKYVEIEPIDPNDCVMGGQRWKARFDLADFRDNASGAISVRTKGEVHLKVKAYCAAAEPKTRVRLVTYLYPGKCSSTLNTTATGTICNSTCSQSTCPDKNWIFLGSGATSVSITCPGCVTPGWSIRPNVVVPLRHGDYLGYEDDDDDGKPTLDASGNPVPITDTSKVNLKKVRYGDVMTMNFSGNMFEGGPSPTKPGFTSSQLAVNPGYTPLVLNKVACDIQANPGFRNFFQPIVVNGSSNPDVIDDVSLADYQAYENRYASFLEYNIDGIGSNTQLPIDDDHMVWINNSTLRVAFTIDEIYLADSSFNDTVPDFFTNETIHFRLRFITDVDAHSRNDYLGDRLLEFNLLMYSTDITMAQLLGTATTSPLASLEDHGSTLATSETAQTWWCEAGAGQISVAPHIESRHFANQKEINSTEVALRDRGLQFPQISRTAEVGPCIIFQSGLKTSAPGNIENNINYYKNEVRPTSLPSDMVFYVPKPYAPEALVISNNVRSRTNNYDGLVGTNVVNSGNPDYANAYVIDLKDPTTHQLPGIPSTGPLVLGFGITIEEGVYMDPAYYPTDASGPIFDPAHAVEHYKITVPYTYFYEAAQYNATHSFQVVGGSAPSYRQYFNAADNISQYPNAVPLAKGDEYHAMNAYVMYSMPQCNASGTYTEDCGFMREHEDFIYYFGDYDITSRMSYSPVNTAITFSVYDPANPPLVTSTQNDYQVLPRMYASRETPLICPQQVLTTPIAMPTAAAPMLSTLDEGVNNYYVAPGSLYPGAVPAASYTQNPFGHQGSAQTVLNFFFTQHSEIEVDQVVNAQFNPQTSEFTFEFSLQDIRQEELRPQAGPCGIVDTSIYGSIDNFLTQTSTGALNNKRMLKDIKGGLVPKNATVDLSNFYFYLEPVIDPSNPNSLLLDLSKDLLITDVNRTGYKAQNQGTFGAGVAPGLSNGDPRLFYLGDLWAAGKDVNGAKNTIVVKGKFNCNDPATIAKINQSNTNGISFPFNVHVNYSTQMDKATLAVPQALNTLGKPELSYQDALASQCSNDDVIEGFELNVPQVFMATNLSVSGGITCSPTGTLTVTNLGGSVLELQQVQLVGLPQGLLSSPWSYDASTSLYIYDLTTTSGSQTVGTDLTTSSSMNIALPFNTATCQNLGESYSISATTYAKTYCSDCETSLNPANCQISKTSTASLQMGNVHLRDFSGYQAFQSPCATLASGGQVSLHWNEMLNGVDLSDASSYGPNDVYTFDFNIGTTNFVRTLSANASGLANFFAASYSINNNDLDSLCAGNPLQIQLNSVEVSSSCGSIACSTEYVLGTSCDVYHSPMVLSTSIVDATCQGLSDGSATVVVQSGMGPYSYVWNNQQNGATAVGLGAGNYSVTVTDGMGCEEVATVTVVEPALPVVSLVTDSNANFCQDSFITLTASGAGFYTWSHDNSTTASVQVSQSGTYVVTGSNLQNSSCTASASIYLPPSLFECCPDFLDFSNYTGFEDPCATLLPNGQIQINWELLLNGNALNQPSTFGSNEDYTFHFTIEGQPYSAILNAGNAGSFFSQGYTLDPALLADFCKSRKLEIALTSIVASYEIEGIYCEEVFDFENQTCDLYVDPISLSCDVTDVSCKGQNDGSAMIQVSGGLAPYTYDWSPTPGSGQGTAHATLMAPGTYSVVVKDAFGCKVEKKVVIGTTRLPEIKISVEGDFCLDGSVSITAQGANFYSWSNGSSGATVQIVNPGTYTVYGTMIQGSPCQGMATVTLEESLFDCCPAATDPQYVQVGGNITSDTYWPHKVVLTSDVYVLQGATLDITNCDVIANYNGIHHSIHVVDAELEATNSTFRPCDASESWPGIQVYKGGSAQLSECVLINAQIGVRVESSGSVRLSNNQFLNNQTAAYFIGSRGEKASKHLFTGNTVTIDDRTPFFDDYFGIRLERGIKLEGQIAQNDFVLASNNSKLYQKHFYGIYLRNAQAVASHNTFTNVRAPYFQTECNYGACSFENNKVDYNTAYLVLSNDYAAVTLMSSRAQTTVSGNTLLNAIESGAKTYGVYCEDADNLLIEGNTIEDFYYGIRVAEGENINLVENTIDDAVWGIEGRENSYVQVLDNHLTDVSFVGILIGSSQEHDGIAISNNYVQAINGVTNYGIMYGNGSEYKTENVELNHNCVKDAQYAMWAGTGQQCAPIPEIIGNSLFNYSKVGMHIEGYRGNIGSCKAGTPGRNSFVSELQSAVDVRFFTIGKCNIVLQGNYPLATVLSLQSYPANRVFAGNACGIFGSSAECGASGGYVPTEVYRKSIRKNKDILISPNGVQIAPDFEKHLEIMLAEDRLEHVLGMMAVLPSTELQSFSSDLQGPLSHFFEPGELHWIAYYKHLADGNLDEAAQSLAQAEKESEVFEQLKVYEGIKLNVMRKGTFESQDLEALQKLENAQTKVGIMARALLNEATTVHPFVYQSNELLFSYLTMGETELSALDASSFAVYPNPTRGLIDVAYQLSSEMNSGAIEVRNVHGQLVKRVELEHEVATESLDLSQLASGLYHVSILKDGMLEFATTVVKD